MSILFISFFLALFNIIYKHLEFFYLYVYCTKSETDSCILFWIFLTNLKYILCSTQYWALSSTFVHLTWYKFKYKLRICKMISATSLLWFYFKHTSWISALVLLSWGSLYSVYFNNILSISVLAYWKSLLLELKMIKAISQSHSMLSSYAFFIKPNFLLVNVTFKENKKF